MIDVVYLRYEFDWGKIVFGVNRNGHMVSIWLDGKDCSDDGRVEHRIISTFQEKGIDGKADIEKAFMDLDEKRMKAKVCS